jgi:acyl-CoA synthetase (AMP-forming)/AMP-acid ligase II
MTEPVFPDFVPTAGNLLAEGAVRFADREAVVTADDRVTYAELDRRSRTLAARLVAHGVGKGTRVATLFPNGVPWVVAWAAAARIGAVVVPVNTFYPAPELATFLRHADIEVVLGVDAFLHHDYLSMLETIAPPLASSPSTPVRPLHLVELPSLRSVLLWGPQARPWTTGGLGDDTPAGTPAGTPADTAVDDLAAGLEAAVTPADPMVMIYTSGSTGEPKGVVHGHGPLIRHARNLAAMSDLGPDSRTWTPMPLFWVGGLVFTLLRHLVAGGALVTQEVFEPGAALRLISAERVTTAGAWPAVTRAIIDHPDFPSTDLSALTGGTLLPAIPGAPAPADPTLAINSLGMTETGGPHTYYWKDEESAPEAYRGTFGHQVPGMEHRIVDPVSGEDLPEGEEGEVLVRGYSLMLGMHKRERSAVFDPDGWYRTEDRGYFRDGWFFFTGRQSDLIKTSGSNVAPAEVETCLATAPGVKLAFVLGVPHPIRGQDVVALIVPSAAGAVDPDAVRAGLKARLSSYKVPRRVILIGDADVPWLPSMKADRRALTAFAEKLAAAPPPP